MVLFSETPSEKRADSLYYCHAIVSRCTHIQTFQGNSVREYRKFYST